MAYDHAPAELKRSMEYTGSQMTLERITAAFRHIRPPSPYAYPGHLSYGYRLPLILSRGWLQRSGETISLCTCSQTGPWLASYMLPICSW